MKPTKEEVYPYLPYDVQCVYTNIKEIQTTYTVNPSNVLELTIYSNVKLVLRPLSDLTKEIEINEKKFIPNENVYIPDTCGDEIYLGNNILNLSFNTVRKLISWHIDVFNLIPQGKAIDKNTI